MTPQIGGAGWNGCAEGLTQSRQDAKKAGVCLFIRVLARVFIDVECVQP